MGEEEGGTEVAKEGDRGAAGEEDEGSDDGWGGRSSGGGRGRGRGRDWEGKGVRGGARHRIERAKRQGGRQAGLGLVLRGSSTV